MQTEVDGRIRQALATLPDVTEVRMFGGVCFMLHGNMLVCSMKDGTMLARIGADRIEAATDRAGVSRMSMRGREMKDFVVVDAERLEGDGLGTWIKAARAFVGPMPPKARAPRR